MSNPPTTNTITGYSPMPNRTPDPISLRQVPGSGSRSTSSQPRWYRDSHRTRTPMITSAATAVRTMLVRSASGSMSWMNGSVASPASTKARR